MMVQIPHVSSGLCRRCSAIQCKPLFVCMEPVLATALIAAPNATTSLAASKGAQGWGCDCFPDDICQFKFYSETSAH